MSSDVAIRIQGLGKSYRIRHQEQHVTLAEQALHRVRHPFDKPAEETFWALKDVDLEIRRGEVLGLIGRNGAGKSTLLKVLSRITAPTTGRVDLFGRVGSLLEVGTGFHPELTGRENIYLNGSILGMRKPEIERQFDAIVDFAGVERFLDTPVKRYSSGMYVRLAFAVAAHLDTEILLVDEVLAVGDSEFQRKCLGTMENVASEGRAVVFVSHNMNALSALCTSAVLLENGSVAMVAPPSHVIGHHLTSGAPDVGATNDLGSLPRHRCYQTGRSRLVNVEFESVDGIISSVEHGLRARFALWSDEPSVEPVAIVMVLHDNRQAPLLSIIADDLTFQDSGAQRVHVTVPELALRPGRYSATLVVTSARPLNGHVDHDVVPDAFMLDVVSVEGRENGRVPSSWGDVRVPAKAFVIGTVTS